MTHFVCFTSLIWCFIFVNFLFLFFYICSLFFTMPFSNFLFFYFLKNALSTYFEHDFGTFPNGCLVGFFIWKKNNPQSSFSLMATSSLSLPLPFPLPLLIPLAFYFHPLVTGLCSCMSVFINTRPSVFVLQVSLFVSHVPPFCCLALDSQIVFLKLE